MNYCARSVVTCDSRIEADEIMVPRTVAFRLTSPVVVRPFNHTELTQRLARGEVLFLQRAGRGQRMRAIAHVAMQLYIPEDRDCILRRDRKYNIWAPPLPTADDVLLPVQCRSDGRETRLCFGDRILSQRRRAFLDPLRSVACPERGPRAPLSLAANPAGRGHGARGPQGRGLLPGQSPAHAGPGVEQAWREREAWHRCSACAFGSGPF